MNDFVNEALIDFSVPENRELMQQAIAQVRSLPKQTWPLRIAGHMVQTSGSFESRNPANPDEVLGAFALAGEKEAKQALASAWSAFPTWCNTTPKDRSAILENVVRLLKDSRHEMNAAMVLEVGKSWIEADADTAEAIDFLTFYAAEAKRYAAEQPLTRIAGESNQLRYIPLGAGVIIPPWNFPCAILLGMAAAAIVSGNTVVLKPASDSPLVANLCYQLFQDAGLPNGVVNLVTGPGKIAGEVLVAHPRTRFIAFTGSMAIGLRINELAARPQKGQIWLKRVVAEMGGKNAIIVDDQCNLEAAVNGVLSSAYGFQGQKCSACSRAIVLDSIYDQFVEKLVAKTQEISMGSPEDPSTFLGPLINKASLEKTLKYIEIGKNEGKLLTGGFKAESSGYFIEPTIFGNVSPEATIAQEEIFGPVLAIIRVKDFSEALDVANNTIYGLTGSVYSNNRVHLDMAGDRFHVGNLYYNRKSTGALVDVHPFGGFNMSGTDSKAGGRDYLSLFTQAKTISEATGL